MDLSQLIVTIVMAVIEFGIIVFLICYLFTVLGKLEKQLDIIAKNSAIQIQQNNEILQHLRSRQ